MNSQQQYSVQKGEEEQSGQNGATRVSGQVQKDMQQGHLRQQETRPEGVGIDDGQLSVKLDICVDNLAMNWLTRSEGTSGAAPGEGANCEPSKPLISARITASRGTESRTITVPSGDGSSWQKGLTNDLGSASRVPHGIASAALSLSVTLGPANEAGQNKTSAQQNSRSGLASSETIGYRAAGQQAPVTGSSRPILTANSMMNENIAAANGGTRPNRQMGQAGLRQSACIQDAKTGYCLTHQQTLIEQWGQSSARRSERGETGQQRGQEVRTPAAQVNMSPGPTPEQTRRAQAVMREQYRRQMQEDRMAAATLAGMANLGPRRRAQSDDENAKRARREDTGNSEQRTAGLSGSINRPQTGARQSEEQRARMTGHATTAAVNHGRLQSSGSATPSTPITQRQQQARAGPNLIAMSTGGRSRITSATTGTQTEPSDTVSGALSQLLELANWIATRIESDSRRGAQQRETGESDNGQGIG